MKPNDFFRPVVTPPGPGELWSSERHEFEREFVVRLRKGPLEGTEDRDAGEALGRLIHSELEQCGTSGSQRLDDDEIAEAIRSFKSLMRRLGLDFNPPFRDFRGFHGYWSAEGMGGPGGWAARRGYLNKLFAPVWERLDELDEASTAAVGFLGVDGEPRNIIFASKGAKPEIVWSQVMDGAIEIVEHADQCLLYNKPLTDAGLTWGELVDWWRQENHLEESPERDVAISLYERLKASLSSDAERHLFYAFASRYSAADGRAQPVLLPQVYLHFDPLTERQRQLLHKPRRLARERMDFLMLLPGGVRIVIEVDGKHHYAREVPSGTGQWQVASDLYSEMVAEDRALRLLGYEVFRFGGHEILQAKGDLTFMRRFFADLESRFWGATVR
ncbi:hypothetical protein [Streptomyces sp. VRA16 Mangrove soil]|uniref:hypothetical protein n=1 Tax=Streptomyces sp. VRA16 Mangrove soil TaxID=2817434 RepID=UPI001A9FC9C5|nr:hypothetical protein [Streptomyces sp. VRA16 Mangrove soil]MBO1333732.1 hypothetical protein [Streptomyces sp. VRA16 Mangrove soil]